jgi:hypothetical protein
MDILSTVAMFLYNAQTLTNVKSTNRLNLQDSLKTLYQLLHTLRLRFAWNLALYVCAQFFADVF